MSRGRATTIVMIASFTAAIAIACGDTLGTDDELPAPSRDGGVDVVVEDGRSHDDVAEVDVTKPPVACNLDLPFGNPTPIAELASDAAETSPHLTDDELDIVFQSRRGAAGALPSFYVAHRASRTAAFDTPQPFPIYQEGDTDPVYSGDGLSLYFSTDKRLDSQSYDLWVTERTSLAGIWGVPFRVLGTSTTDPEFHPFARAGGLFYTRLQQASDRSIWFAQRTNGAFNAGIKVDGLDEPGVDDETPTPSADGLSIYFASRRMTAGDLDIWFARRTKIDEAFASPTRVVELSTPEDDSPGWISPDGCRLYLVRSSIKDGGSDLDIYVAEKPLN